MSVKISCKLEGGTARSALELLITSAVDFKTERH